MAFCFNISNTSSAHSFISVLFSTIEVVKKAAGHALKKSTGKVVKYD
jgi:hypothetical protein